jgi:CheY-like chemotaxis protein
VLEPFFTTKTEGTGLGLAMVNATMTSHAGAIEIASAVGNGTTITLYFPANEVAAAARRPRRSITLQETARRILVVDDDVAIRGMIQRALKARGRDVLVADCAEQGLTLLEKGPIDLVILDMMMPGIGGAAAFHRMREQRPNLKVIIISGFSHKGDVERCVDAGACAFLAKPFQMSQLDQAISTAFAD